MAKTFYEDMAGVTPVTSRPAVFTMQNTPKTANWSMSTPALSVLSPRARTPGFTRFEKQGPEISAFSEPCILIVRYRIASIR